MTRLGLTDNGLDALFLAAAARHCPPGWEPGRLAAVLKAIAAVETGGTFNPEAFVADDGGSGCSAVGLMQLNAVAVADLRERDPSVPVVPRRWDSPAAARAGGDPRLDPARSIELAARYLASMRTRYGHVDLETAIGCYNGGPANPVAAYARRVLALAERYAPVAVAAPAEAGASSVVPRPPGASAATAPESAYTRAVGVILTEAERVAGLGVPYRWGGIDLDGFDCAGLVVHCYARAGLALPRTAEAQWQSARPVEADSAAPADLVFFWGSDPATPPDEASHVAIWCGDGTMIHAPGEGATVRRETWQPGGFWAGLQHAWARPLVLRALAAAPPLPARGAMPGGTGDGVSGPAAGDASGSDALLAAGALARVAAIADKLNLRAAPGLDGAVLGVLPAATPALVLGGPVDADGYHWWQVLTPAGDPRVGWVAGAYLVPLRARSPLLPVPGGSAVAVAVVGTGGEGLRLRAAPSVTAPIRQVLLDGSIARLLELGPVVDGRAWARIAVPGRAAERAAPARHPAHGQPWPVETGWVAARWLCPLPAELRDPGAGDPGGLT